MRTLQAETAPAIGGFPAAPGSGGSGVGKRRPAADEMAQVTTDPARSPEMDMVNDAVRQAGARVNSGHYHSGLDGAGPIHDPDGLLSGGGSGSETTSWADPSSGGSQ